MEFQGSALLRYRVITSLLMGIPISITKIRSKSEYPGLTDAEVKYLQLICRITSGSEVDINAAGTILKFTPGVIVNNPNNLQITFDCGRERGLSFFLEGVLPIVLFGKNKLDLQLIGRSHCEEDIGVDVVQYVQIPIIKKFGVEEISLKIQSRGDEGAVILTVTPVKNLSSASLEDTGRVKRVRGVAFTSKMNVQMGNRAAYAAKGQLHSFLPDIWIHTDHYKQGEALLGITLSAETTSGAAISSEYLRGEKSQFDYLESEVPEDLGTLAVMSLLDEIMYGGYVDTNNQGLPLLLMALAPDQSSIRLGRVSSMAIEVMRLIKQMMNIQFAFKDIENQTFQEENEENENFEDTITPMPKNTIVSCTGINYHNMARVAF